MPFDSSIKLIIFIPSTVNTMSFRITCGLITDPDKGDLHTERFSFPNKVMGILWLSQINHIKTTVENRNIDAPTDIYQANARTWVQLVREFKNTWGERCVPSDIRRALNRTESFLGINETTWSNNNQA